MNMSASGLARRLSGLPLAMGLGLALCLASTLQAFFVFTELVPNWSELTGAVDLDPWNSPLGGEVAFFVVAQLVLHAALGIPVWLLARLTEMAWPRMDGRRTRLVIAWFAIVVLWILVANATWFPWSTAGLSSWLLHEPVIGNARVFELFSVALLVPILWLLVRAALALPRARTVLPRTLAYGALAALALVTVQLVRANDADVEPAGDRPNVILIGIDSLRADAVGENGGIGITPNVDAFLREAHHFTDAITPAARTFVSWMTILTGHNPRSNGAREDLMPRAALANLPTLATLLRDQGYRTTFAMDEVRFANIDEGYGFDQVVGPDMGVADFLLGRANDLPLPNLIANTWLAKWLFPFTFGNRAAAHVYEPDTFVDWIDDEVDGGGPQLVAVHFTLSHWPFTWAATGEEVFDRSYDRQYRYATSVIEADKQFGKLMAVLEAKGLLQNAIVVILSDHGEALSKMSTDVMLRGAQARAVLGTKLKISSMGHGTSVLSPSQYSVVLAMRGYGRAEFPMTARTHGAAVSLVDIAPTVLDLAGIRTKAEFDGVSLRPLIEGDAQAEQRLAMRPRFTETGFRTPLLNDKDLDESALLRTGAAFFRMNPANARFEVRGEVLKRLIADKERAAFTSRAMMAAIPLSPEATQHKYIFVDRQTWQAHRVTAAPDASTEPEARLLWDALHAEYGEELLPPEP